MQVSNKLMLKSQTQKALFLLEIVGQLSDGHWENTEPEDHWEIWADLNPDDIVVGDKLGRNFNPVRPFYELDDLDFVYNLADQMFIYARLAQHYPLHIIELAEQYIDFEECAYHKWAKPEMVGEISPTQMAEMCSIVKDDTVYTFDNLLSDLFDISKAMATYLEIE